MSTAPEGVVIVGGSVAGVRCAQALRQKGFTGSIRVVEGEPHAPYDKPELSKTVLTAGDAPRPLLADGEAATLDITLLQGEIATGIDVEARLVETSSGRRVEYSVLVIATGSRARRLAAFGDATNVHYLRTLDDASRLRHDITSARTVAVVGGGFIGGEVASAARTMGSEVTIVEAAGRLMSRSMPAEVAGEVQGIYEAHGVRLSFGAAVAGPSESSHHRVGGIELGDGRQVAADAVVIGIGSVPNTEWLSGSALVLDDGVVCTPDLRAVGVDDVYAVGDVARIRDDRSGVSRRDEHWTSAREQAAVVAQNIVAGGDIEFHSSGYVWSDQFGHRLQHAGVCDPGPDASVEVSSVAGGGRLFLHRSPSGELMGVTGIDAQREFLKARRALLAAAVGPA